MDKLDIEAIKIAVFEVLSITGAKLLPYYGNIATEENKDESYTSGIVTKLDRETEKEIKAHLQAKFPMIGFRGEESGDSNENQSDQLTWLVDPIDGTAHFVRGLPFCTTMIALIINGEVVFSAINDFTQKNIYWAVKGQGAFKNERRIKIKNREPKASLVSFETKLELNRNLELFQEVRQVCAATVATISCGYEFIRIAEGKLDARVTKDPYGMDWDFAPGSLLVKEAGGIVVNHNSNDYNYKNHDFYAGSASLYKSVRTLFDEN